METTANVSYRPSLGNEQIGYFFLEFNGWDGVQRSVGIKFDFKELWDFSRDTTSVAFDFLILSVIVYNVDRAINRIHNSEDGWHRNIILNNVPAINLHAMNRGKEKLDKAIGFLTGDRWDINFVQSGVVNYAPTNNVVNYTHSDYAEVCLFSGGLDSLIGFIDTAHRIPSNKKVLLISHMELGKERKDQEEILSYCGNNHILGNRYERLLINTGLKTKTWNMRTPSESTFRSRSLLFFAAGIYAAHAIDPQQKLLVPENGTISVNIPLDSGRRSACSTRTTHPTFIKKLQEALILIGIDNSIENPYRLKTKADMMNDVFVDPIKRAEISPLVNLSCSCAKRGHNVHWDKSGQEIRDNSITHCGMCLPCIYRRVALNAVGMDAEEKLGTDVLHGVKYNLSNLHQKRAKDFRALLYFLRKRCDEKTIRRELMLNGITDQNDLDEYVNLALHSYDQVKEWLSQKASNNIRQLAGL